eukprot:tig00021314_g20127.t1
MYRAIVTDNPICYKRHQQRIYEEHRERLRTMRSTVHTNARITMDCSPPKYQASRVNLKKIRLQEERYAQIERENTILLEKMSKIMTTASSPVKDDAHVEFAPGIRLNKHQVPVIDNYVSERSSYPGHAYPARSLNTEARKRELQKIMMENQALLRRLQTKEPFYSAEKWEEERKLNEHYLRNIRLYPYGDEPPRLSASTSSMYERYGGQQQYSPHEGEGEPEGGPEVFARTWNGAATGQSLPGAPPSAPANLITSHPPPKRKTLKPLETKKKEPEAKPAAPAGAPPGKAAAKRPGSAGAAPHSLPPLEKKKEAGAGKKEEAPAIRQSFVSPAPDLEPKFQQAEADFAKKAAELSGGSAVEAEDEEARAEREMREREREAVLQQLLSDDEGEGEEGEAGEKRAGGSKGAKREYGYAKYDFKEGASPSPPPGGHEEAQAAPKEEAAASAVMGDVLGAVQENLEKEEGEEAGPQRRAMFADEPAESEGDPEVVCFDEGQRARMLSAKSVRAGPPAKPRDEQEEPEEGAAPGPADAAFEAEDEAPATAAPEAGAGPSDTAEREPEGTARTLLASAPPGEAAKEPEPEPEAKPVEPEPEPEPAAAAGPQEDGDGGYIVEDDAGEASAPPAAVAADEEKEEPAAVEEPAKEEEAAAAAPAAAEEAEAEKPAEAPEEPKEEAAAPAPEAEPEPEPAKAAGEEEEVPEAAEVVGAVFAGVDANLEAAAAAEDRPGTTAGADKGEGPSDLGEREPAGTARTAAPGSAPSGDQKAAAAAAQPASIAEEEAPRSRMRHQGWRRRRPRRRRRRPRRRRRRRRRPRPRRRSHPRRRRRRREPKPAAAAEAKPAAPVPAIPAAAAAAADRESEEAWEQGLQVAVAGLAEEMAAAAALAASALPDPPREPAPAPAPAARPRSSRTGGPAAPAPPAAPVPAPEAPEEPKEAAPAPAPAPAAAAAEGEGEGEGEEAALERAVSASLDRVVDDVATVLP